MAIQVDFMLIFMLWCSFLLYFEFFMVFRNVVQYRILCYIWRISQKGYWGKLNLAICHVLNDVVVADGARVTVNERNGDVCS